MLKYDLDFLREKGFFKDKAKGSIEGREVIIDERSALVYVEVDDSSKIEELKRKLKDEFKSAYYFWFWISKEKKVKVFRKIGEIKWFWFSPERERKETRKSKEEKLRKISPENINVLFDTRDIVNRFYLEIWRKTISIAKGIKELEKDENKIFVAQRFINRLIFFYFVSQLGLIKVRWEEEEIKLTKEKTKKFIEDIIKFLKTDKKLLEFFNNIFFKVFSQIEESGWAAYKFKIDKDQYEVVGPALDGGLFDEGFFEGKKESELTLKHIKEVLEFLNQYNWIIGEEMPEEDRIGDLTPEVIGHIYEKLAVSLEQMGESLKKIKLNDISTTKQELRAGRKKIGAYYTPEEITNYISKNTIYPFLKDKLESRFGKDGRELLEKDYEKYIFREGVQYSNEELKMIKYLYFDFLTNIRVLDNACGSGSFLIAAGEILLRLYSRILKILEEQLYYDNDVKEILKKIRDSPNRNYFIVREIIVNNLYGVDIMPGAVEIARLRLWLWLVSQIDPSKIENKRLETLPNLDFNIMEGNSLIGFVDIENIDFDFLGKQRTLSSYMKNNKIEWLKKIAKKKQEFKKKPIYEALKLKKELDNKLKRAREELNKEFYKTLQSNGIKISWEEFQDLKPFHWGFEFPEVFDLEKPKEERGFDVIIGNPPYVASAGRGNISMKIGIIDKKIFKALYKVAKGQFDLYTIFIERSINTLKYGGKFGYIIPDAILVRDTNYYIREFILKTTSIMQIILAGRCFVGVDNSNSILLLSKPYLANNVLLGIYIDSKYPNNIRLISQLPKTKNDVYINYLYQEDLNKLKNKVFLIKSTKNTLEILNYLRNVASPLKEFIEIRRGEELGKKSTIIINRKKDENYLPIVAGEDFDRYQKIRINKYISYKHIRKSKRFYKEGKLIFRQTSDRLKGTIDNVGVITLKSVYNILPKMISPEILLCLLNSNICNWIYSGTFGNYRKTFPQINQSTLCKVFIRLPTINKPFITLADYLLFLNATEQRRNAEKELIEFIDKQVVDSLVYELYFKEKFHEDGLYPQAKEYLLQEVSKHLKPINYDRWSELYWKKQLEGELSEEERKELERLDKENIKTIKEVVEKIRKDKKILELINKIKSHKWVKIVEGKER